MCNEYIHQYKKIKLRNNPNQIHYLRDFTEHYTRIEKSFTMQIISI